MEDTETWTRGRESSVPRQAGLKRVVSVLEGKTRVARGWVGGGVAEVSTRLSRPHLKEKS